MLQGHNLLKWLGVKHEIPKGLWLAYKLGTGQTGEDTTVTGNSPLTLANALARHIKSLTQYGLCSQASTPTPSSPVPIVCNNGTLKMVHRSGLPEGYRLLEYVGGSGSQYVITNVYLASTDVVECEYRNSSTTGYGAIYGIYKTGDSSALYGNQTYYGYNEANNKVDSGVSVDTEWHSSRHDFVNGTLTIDNTSVSFTPFEFTNSTKNAVLSRYYNGSYGYNWKGYIRKFKVTRGGEVICDLLPAKNSSDVAGLYDLISGSFYTATGGTLLEGNEVDDYEFRIVGTPESISITASGADAQTATAENLLSCGAYADEQDIVSGAVTRKIGVHVFDGTEPLVDTMYGAGALFSCNVAYNAPVLCTHLHGTTYEHMMDEYYQAFVDLGVFPYGIALVDWAYSYFSDAATCKSWLATQYAAGTPVIVIYPLVEEVTESVAPQPLTTAEGTNTITVTANVSPISLECEYIASA